MTATADHLSTSDTDLPVVTPASPLPPLRRQLHLRGHLPFNTAFNTALVALAHETIHRCRTAPEGAAPWHFPS